LGSAASRIGAGNGKNEERQSYNFKSILVSTITVIESRNMRWAGHVARIGKCINIGIWWERHRERAN
jgi:hypothetical protein